MPPFVLADNLEARASYPVLPLSATMNSQTAIELAAAYEVAMVEPRFDFAARLAELIDEARNPVKAIGNPLSEEEIIDFLEEAILTLRVELLKPGGSRHR